MCQYEGAPFLKSVELWALISEICSEVWVPFDKTQRIGWGIYLDGVPNNFTERWWGMKTYSIFKKGNEIFLDYVKLSSALVPRIKNDHSLTSAGTTGLCWLDPKVPGTPVEKPLS